MKSAALFFVLAFVAACGGAYVGSTETQKSDSSTEDAVWSDECSDSDAGEDEDVDWPDELPDEFPEEDEDEDGASCNIRVNVNGSSIVVECIDGECTCELDGDIVDRCLIQGSECRTSSSNGVVRAACCSF
jgi:hypothetical protein